MSLIIIQMCWIIFGRTSGEKEEELPPHVSDSYIYISIFLVKAITQ